MHPHPTPLTLSDVAIVSILLRRGPAGVSVIAKSFDYLLRQGLEFDELSFGIPRLVAAGLVEVSWADNGEVVLRATGLGSGQLRRDLGEIEAVFSFAKVLGVDPEGRIPEDRSLGRLVGLNKADVTAALRNAVSAAIPIITNPPDVARTRRHRRG